MNVNRQWLLAKRPHGMVDKGNFEYVEAPIPTPGDGEVLVRNLFLSFDPTQRGWMEDRESYLPPVQLGEPMRAGSIGQVAESNHPDFAVGDMVQTTGGWQDFVIVAPGQGFMGLNKVPDGVPAEMIRPRCMSAFLASFLARVICLDRSINSAMLPFPAPRVTAVAFSIATSRTTCSSPTSMCWMSKTKTC